MFNRPETSLMFYLLDIFCNAFRFVDPTHTRRIRKILRRKCKMKKKLSKKGRPSNVCSEDIFKIGFYEPFFSTELPGQTTPGAWIH